MFEADVTGQQNIRSHKLERRGRLMKAAHKRHAVCGILVVDIRFRHIFVHSRNAGMRHFAVIHHHVMFRCRSLSGCGNRRRNKLKHHSTNDEHKAQRPKRRLYLLEVEYVAHGKMHAANQRSVQVRIS